MASQDARHRFVERTGFNERAGHHVLGPKASLGQPVAGQHVSLRCHGEGGDYMAAGAWRSVVQRKWH